MPWSLCPNFLTLFSSPKQPLTVSIHLSRLCERDGSNVDLYDWLLLLNIFKIMILFYIAVFHPLWLPNSIPLSGYTTFLFVFISVCEGVGTGRERAHTCKSSCRGTQMGEQLQLSFLIFHLVWDTVSRLLLCVTGKLADGLRGLSCLSLSSQHRRSGYRCVTFGQLYTASGNLNLGPQMWASGALPTERSPQPCASQLLFAIGGEHLDHFHSGEIMNDTKSWVPSPTLKEPAEVVV